MRTFDEINRNMQKVVDKMDNGEFENDDEFWQLLNHFKKLKKEKEEVWDALYEGHRNFKI